jgi:oligopeptide transport system permease protein
MKFTAKIQASSQAPATQALTPEMFAPKLANAEDAEKLTRPILTYFQDAALRFYRNKVGMVCLSFLAVITLIGIVGPFFFPNIGDGVAYENALNTDFQNQKPTLGEPLVVVDDGWAAPEPQFKQGFPTGATLLTQENLTAPKNLTVQGAATVNGVTLQWDPVEGSSGYEIFRISGKEEDLDLEALRKGASSMGMTLGRLEDPSQYSFTDSTGLDPSDHYAYAVQSFVTTPDGETITSTESSVVKTHVTKTIKLADSLHLNPSAQSGQTLSGRTFVFGTDSLGRDIFARMVMGTRVNFSLAIIVPTICLLLGLIYGAISGLSGGKVDLIMMRIIEVLDTLPYLLLMIIMQLVMGKGVLSLIIAMCAFGWTGFARVIRGEVLRLREIEFVHASRLLGAPITRLIFKQIAPNLIGLILVVWSSRLPSVIVSEAFLSLLGLGLEAPAASWGMVLNEAAQQFQSYPIQFLLPASVMATTLLAFFLLGDALTDALDPKLRGRD